MVCFFGLVLYAGFHLLHWVFTGELAAIFKGGGPGRTLSWEDEPGYFIFTVIVRIAMLVFGGWGMIDVLRKGARPPQAPE